MLSYLSSARRLVSLVLFFALTILPVLSAGAAPDIKNVSPSSAALGQQVRLNVAGVPAGTLITVRVLQNGLSVPVSASSINAITGTDLTRVTFVLPSGSGLQPTSGTAPLPAQVVVEVSGEGASSPVAFTINPPPSLASVSPGNALRGATNVNVVLTGVFTAFRPGLTTASFGPGITVNSLVVMSTTQATANISIAQNATVGQRAVSVSTGAQFLTLASAFEIQAVTPTLTLSLTLDRTIAGRVANVTASRQVVVTPAQVTPTVVVRDATGNVVTPTPAVNFTVNGADFVFGNGSLSGSNIVFTDNAAGRFNITASLASNPAVSDTEAVTVLGTGDAEITLNLERFITQAGNLLQAMAAADQANDRATFQSLLNQLNTLRQQPAYSPRLLRLNNAFNPQAGFIPTRAQVVAAGLPSSGPDDAQFAVTLSQIQQNLRAVLTQVNAIPANPTPESVNALGAALASLNQAIQQFAALRPSTAAFVEHASQFNATFADELPVVARATIDKIIDIVGTGGIRPESLFGNISIAQALNLSGFAFNAYRDYLLIGAQDIAESVAALLIRNLVNANVPGGVRIEAVLGFSTIVAAGQLTYVLGSGFNPVENRNYVLLVGPAVIDPVLEAASAVAGLFDAGNLWERLAAVKEIVQAADEAVARGGLLNKDAIQDAIPDGFSDGFPQFLVFLNGFSGELVGNRPLGGTVFILVQNKDTGGANAAVFRLVRPSP